MRYRIFVPLASDPVALQEMDAEPAGDGQFRIVGSAPSGEALQFHRGEIVECEIRTLPNGSKDLVAIRSVSADPEFKKRRNLYATLGALVGGVIGAAVALWFRTSAVSAATGFVVGAFAFAYSSVRWRDDAWVFLSRLVRWR